MKENDEIICEFGTALEPLDKDEIPSKKPIAIEDQIATDVNGRRRFHGAFTGGFSAGFWNTVGSLEGWKPQNFKSSRSEKADTKQQNVIDFMDDEDLGEFGIAPQRMQTTEEFTSKDLNVENRKRKLQNKSYGPIPGIPVLHQLLEPAKENVAIRLLKKMGWKFGQGIGARQTHKEKKAASKRNERERYVLKRYGCDLGPIENERIHNNDDDDDDNENDDNDSNFSFNEITFAPDDFEPIICGIKDNTFGLGYSGLSRDPVLSKSQQKHIDLFGSFEEGLQKTKKNLSIRGQAFGVGAFEEEDEDIYANDDLTKYDFSLDERKKVIRKKIEYHTDPMIIENFHLSQVEKSNEKKIFEVIIPQNYKPRNWSVRKSRFEPLDDNKVALLKSHDEYKRKGLGRHDLNPDERGVILGESSKEQKQDIIAMNTNEKQKNKTYLEKINEKYKNLQSKHHDEVMNLLNTKQDNFSKGETLNDDDSIDTSNILDESVQKENEKVQEQAKHITKSEIDENNLGNFKPFINNESKQERYEKFLKANLENDEEIIKLLTSIQPLSMSDWDREKEKQEFIQAKKIYKPLNGIMSNRFISESTIQAEKEAAKNLCEMKKMKMLRTKIMWKPCSQLCKRFNIPEPFGGRMIDEKHEKKSKFSIFDYLDGSINTKENFITPVIIPKKIEKPNSIVKQNLENNKIPLHILEKIVEKEPIKVEIIENIKKSMLEDEKKHNIRNSLKDDKKKSNLEKKIEETKNNHPSEKKDLFKAIFENSSEDENDENDENNKRKSIDENIFDISKSCAEVNLLRNTSPPRGIFSYLFKDKETNKTKNIIINKIHLNNNSNSEIKKSQFELIENKNNEIISMKSLKKSEIIKSINENDMYGPKIPEKINISTSSTTDQHHTNTINSLNIVSELKGHHHNDKVDEKLLKLLKKSKKNSGIIEEWVEKDQRKKKRKKDKKKKSSKKHKKDKKSHKKSK